MNNLYSPFGLDRPDAFAGMQVHIMDAQLQMRTIRDVKGPWLRPKVPSKRIGRKGTRRSWKRDNPPHCALFYREPGDVLILNNKVIIATPAQADALRRHL